MQISIPGLQAELHAEVNSNTYQAQPEQLLDDMNDHEVSQVGKAMNSTLIKEIVHEIPTASHKFSQHFRAKVDQRMTVALEVI